MTEKELNQMHYINKEIAIRKKELESLRSKSIVKSQVISGMPFPTGISDKTADLATTIREVEELIEIKLKELFLVRGRIERFINTIEKSDIRLIVRLRAINNLSWEDIAAELTILDEHGEIIKEVSRQTVWRKYRKFLSDLDTMDSDKCYTGNVII